MSLTEGVCRTLFTWRRAHSCLIEAWLAQRARHAGRIGALLSLFARTAFLLSPLAFSPDSFVALGTFYEFVYAISCCVLGPITDNDLPCVGAFEVRMTQGAKAIVAPSSFWAGVTSPVAPVCSCSPCLHRRVGLNGAVTAFLRPYCVLELACCTFCAVCAHSVNAFGAAAARLALLRRCLRFSRHFNWEHKVAVWAALQLPVFVRTVMKDPASFYARAI